MRSRKLSSRLALPRVGSAGFVLWAVGRERSLGKAGSTREAEVFPKERSVLAPLKSIFHFLSIGVFLRSHLHVVKRRDPKCLVRELCLWDDHSVHCSTSPR